jgi:hypothetical protein
VDALPDRIRPIHKCSRVVECEESRDQHSGFAGNRRGDRFGTRILHGFRMIRGDSQHGVRSRVNAVGDACPCKCLPRSSYSVVSEDVVNRISDPKGASASRDYLRSESLPLRGKANITSSVAASMPPLDSYRRMAP